MPKVYIETDDGKRVGEVPVYLTGKEYAHGWDGMVFEALWAEALRRERVAEMVEETEV